MPTPPRPAPGDALGSLHGDGSRKTVHPADVHGPWKSRRQVLFVVLGAVFLGLPWLRIGGRPAVLLDLPHRHFYLFGAIFTAADAWLLLFLFTGVGFSLVVLTTLAGRAWCAGACPQTVFVEGVYRRIERAIMGPREARLRREREAWTADKVGRTVALWTLYLLVSSFLAHAVLGYFFPVRTLLARIAEGPAAHPEAFGWTVGVTALLLFDFGWFREQFCVVMCPYGRFQSVLTDRDSKVVAYDRKRGEPRGKLHVLGNGDCVDCRRCVAVCPTAIDIRDGLQLECIGCTACIDACDDIMQKVEKPRGLIRWDSERGLEGKPPASLLRPRIVGYAIAGLVGAIAFGTALATRQPVEITLQRARGGAAVAEGDVLRGVLQLEVRNRRGEPIQCQVTTPPNGAATIEVPLRAFEARPLTTATSPAFVTVPRVAYHGPLTVALDVACGDRPVRVSAPFVGP